MILTICDHLDWSDALSHQAILQEKLNKYLAFIEGGEIYSAYPTAKGKAVQISIIAQFQPDEAGVRFLSAAKAIVENAGIGFEFQIFSPPPDA